jgi:HK97 family phage portal protein
VSLFFGRPARSEERADRPTDSLFEMFRRRLTPTSGGAPVDTYSALTHSAVYQCVDLIADLVAGFPVQRVRRAGRERITMTNKTVVEEPSTDVDSLNWRRLLVIGWLMRGYTPALVTGTRDGYPTGLELIHPDRLTASRDRPDAPLRLHVDGREMDRWPRGRLWVANGKMLNPYDGLGRSVLEFAREEAGLGLAARRYASQFFRDGGHPTAVLMNEKPVSEDGARRVKERFMKALSGTREPAVFGDNWQYKQIQIKPEESQFLETVKANRTLVAGFFRVPPEIIGAPSASGMTYVNVEHRGIDLLRFTISSWVYRMETVLDALVPRTETVKLNTDNLLRTDLSARYRAYDQGIRAGFLSVNDVRTREDEEPIEGGDQYLWPPYRQQLTYDELSQDPDSPPWTDEPTAPVRPDTPQPASPPASPPPAGAASARVNGNHREV